MNTQTTTHTGELIAHAHTLKTVLSVLDLYTASDKTRHALTLAHVTPIIIELTPEQDRAGMIGQGLAWAATNSHTLIEITHRAWNNLTGPTVIDPAAILATMPKPPTRETHTAALTLGADTWRLATCGTETSGPAANLNGHTWPKTAPLFQNQSTTITPYAVDPDYLAQLAKAAKIMKAEQVRHVSQGTRDGQPSNITPLVFVIEAENLSARVIVMPQRMN